MTDQEKLLTFQIINDCETFDQLKFAVKCIALKNNGVIKGKTKDYTVEKMLRNIESVRKAFNDKKPGMWFYYRTLTREFGIRQQAIYLHTYGEI